jgi:hypothetical protein
MVHFPRLGDADDELSGNPTDRRIPLHFCSWAVWFPCSAEKISLLGGVVEFRSDPYNINHLNGSDSSCQGPEQAFLLFFPVEQRNPMTGTHARNSLRPSPVGQISAEVN